MRAENRLIMVVRAADDRGEEAFIGSWGVAVVTIGAQVCLDTVAAVPSCFLLGFFENKFGNVFIEVFVGDLVVHGGAHRGADEARNGGGE